MKLKKEITSRYIALSMKVRLFMRNRYIAVRKKFLDKWTRIPEKSRIKFISTLSIVLNYLVNALLLAVPISLLTTVSYPKTVICIWFSLPFIEHYYVWFRENWKDNLIKD